MCFKCTCFSQTVHAFYKFLCLFHIFNMFCSLSSSVFSIAAAYRAIWPVRGLQSPGVGPGHLPRAVLQPPPRGRAGHSVLITLHMQGLGLPQAGETALGWVGRGRGRGYRLSRGGGGGVELYYNLRKGEGVYIVGGMWGWREREGREREGVGAGEWVGAVL